jgi:hypothetical protein
MHAEYQSLPAGTRKTRLETQLFRDNEPLLRTIIDQITGRWKPKFPGQRVPYAARMGGRFGLSRLEYEDAMQAGRVAFGKAIRDLDPKKGKISGYLAMKCLAEVQNVATFGHHLFHLPDGRPEELRMSASLVGLPSEDEAMGGTWRAYVQASDDIGAPIAVDGVTPEDLAEWERTGEWPESLEEWEAQKAAREAVEPRVVLAPSPVVYSFPRPVVVVTGLDLFVEQCVLHENGKGSIEMHAAWNAYRIECRIAGLPELPRSQFIRELVSTWDVRETSIRVDGKPRRAIGGIRLRTAA